jgi:hypothetical protein
MQIEASRNTKNLVSCTPRAMCHSGWPLQEARRLQAGKPETLNPKPSLLCTRGKVALADAPVGLRPAPCHHRLALGICPVHRKQHLSPLRVKLQHCLNMNGQAGERISRSGSDSSANTCPND